MMRFSRWTKAALVSLGLAAATVVPAVSTTNPVSAQTDAIAAGGEYFPVDPERILNTRDADLPNNQFGRKATSPGGSIVRVPVVGRAGLPNSADQVLAVAVSVVAIQPNLRGNLAVRPSGASASSNTSLVNFEAFDTTTNLGIVGVGADGAIEIDVKTSGGNGTIDLIVDVFGWIATSSFDDAADEGARVRSATPARLINTRNSSQLPNGMTSARRLNPGESVEIDVRGELFVPDNDNVTAVIVNLTGANPSARTHLSITPTRPNGKTTSNGNYPPGATRANMVIAPLNEDGSIWLTNGGGPIDAIVDVLGYLERGASADTDAGRVVPLSSPFRSFNTAQSEFGSVRLGQGQWEDWSFTKFAESVELNGVTNIAQQGFFANLVGFQLQNANRTHIAMNPREAAPFTSAPENSNVNLFSGQAAGNMTLVRYGTNGEGDDKMVAAYNNSGAVHYHLDVFAIILDD